MQSSTVHISGKQIKNRTQINFFYNIVLNDVGFNVKFPDDIKFAHKLNRCTTCDLYIFLNYEHNTCNIMQNVCWKLCLNSILMIGLKCK